MWRFLKKLAAVPPKPHTPDEALTSFCTNRELLQNHFFRLAAASGKPRGLIWKSCHWLSTAAVAADGDDGLMLFCGVNVSFEAVAGGDMEDVAAVSAIRDGSAVFIIETDAGAVEDEFSSISAPQMPSKRPRENHRCSIRTNSVRTKLLTRIVN